LIRSDAAVEIKKAPFMRNVPLPALVGRMLK